MPKVPDTYVKARTAEILAAAAACFARAGYRGTSMAGVAREAGLSVGALYRYFDSKETLFQALTRTARETSAAMWADIASSGDPRAQLRAFVDRYFAMAGDPQCRASLALDIRLRGEALDSGVVRRELQAAYEAQIAALAKLLRAAGGRGARMAEARTRARALIGLLNEAAVQTLLVPGFDVAAYRRNVLRLIRTGRAP